MLNPIILIVEDERPIRTMVRYTLERSDFSVLEAANAKEASAVLAQQLPNLILLDCMMPKQSGIDFTKHLKQNKLTSNIPIIMLTARAEEENKVMGLEAGADDYIVKPFSPRELIARIRAVLRRGPVTRPNNILQIRNLSVDTRSQRAVIGEQSIKLGPLEYRLLHFFMTHQDRVYTRDELLSHVWGVGVYVDERTVDVHIRRLRKQLSIEGHEKLIQTIHGSGYRFSDKNDHAK